MIRLTDNQGERLAQLLGTNEMRLGLQHIGIGIGLIDDLRQVIVEQLAAPRHFDDLIDTVVKIVCDPRLSSLNRDHLGLLRRAILSPLELATFGTKMNSRQSCHGCGRPLPNHEAVTLISKNIHCWVCAHPDCVTCPKCSLPVSAVGLAKTIERALQRHTCVPQEENEDVLAEPGELWIDQPVAAAPVRQEEQRPQPITSQTYYVDRAPSNNSILAPAGRPSASPTTRTAPRASSFRLDDTNG